MKFVNLKCLLILIQYKNQIVKFVTYSWEVVCFTSNLEFKKFKKQLTCYKIITNIIK